MSIPILLSNMKKFLPLCIGLAVFFLGVLAYAQESSVTFPISELGGCKDKAECRAYCDKKANREVCLAFAGEHNLLPVKELERAQKALRLVKAGGPGGCKDLDSCKAYCMQENHADECIVFAKRHELLEEREMEQSSKLREVMKRGVALPGDCTDKVSCEAYCFNEEHHDECIAFGKEHGLISQEEYELAKKTRGKGPGGCSGKDCQEYCRKEEHLDECVAFAREHGLISQKEAQVAQQIRGKGPGGCTREECREYCQEATHEEVCEEFVKDHGLAPQQEDISSQEDFTPVPLPLDQQNRRPLEGNIPAPVVECLKQAIGPQATEEIRNGEIEPTPEMQRNIRACFDRIQELEEDERNHQEERTPTENLGRFGALLLDVAFFFMRH